MKRLWECWSVWVCVKDWIRDMDCLFLGWWLWGVMATTAKLQAGSYLRSLSTMTFVRQQKLRANQTPSGFGSVPATAPLKLHLCERTAEETRNQGWFRQPLCSPSTQLSVCLLSRFRQQDMSIFLCFRCWASLNKVFTWKKERRSSALVLMERSGGSFALSFARFLFSPLWRDISICSV